MHWGRCQGREGQLGLLSRRPNPAQHSWVLESRPEADGRQAVSGREVLTRHAATTGDCWDTAHSSPRTPVAGTPQAEHALQAFQGLEPTAHWEHGP